MRGASAAVDTGEGRVALVTGGNRGIGREIAARLARLRVETILTARDRPRADAAAADLGTCDGKVHGRQLNVTDDLSIERLTSEIETRFGRLDILVNNAGVGLGEPDSMLTPDFELVGRVLDTNLFGAWRLMAALVPGMRERGYGRVVNMSSGVGQLDEMESGFPGYRLSKTGLNALTRMLAFELRGTNVLVNATCPGWVRTDMGGPDAPRSVAEGADTAVWLATLPDGGPAGGFFRDRQPIPW